MIGEIISGGNNYYTVKINYDTSRIDIEIGRLEKLIAELEKYILELDAEIPDNQVKINTTKLRILAYQKKLQYLQAQPKTKNASAWDPVYSETPKTGAVNVNPIPNTDQNTYQICGTGKIAKPINNTPAAAYFNQVIKYWWERWKPTFRHGTLTRKNGAIGSVSFSPAVGDNITAKKGVPINSDCDAINFSEGDSVLIAFNGDPETPTIIGFKDNPKPCIFGCDQLEFVPPEQVQECIDFAVPDNWPGLMAYESNAVLTVQGGCPPFEWSITGDGWTIGETDQGTNIVHASCGAGTITVSCDCGTIEHTIRGDLGHWEFGGYGCNCGGGAANINYIPVQTNHLWQEIQLTSISGDCYQQHIMTTSICNESPPYPPISMNENVEGETTTPCTTCLTWAAGVAPSGGYVGTTPRLCIKYDPRYQWRYDQYFNGEWNAYYYSVLCAVNAIYQYSATNQWQTHNTIKWNKWVC